MFSDPNYWFGLVSGLILAFVVYGLVLPDDWAIWLARRRNFPHAILPLGLVLLAVVALNLIFALGWAILRALGLVQFASWLWLALIAGLVIVAIWIIFRPREPRTT